ncbi:MAG: hypothetical protein HY785_00150 [Oscillatoriophycideae cyanobacterium NC_groundwater_1537_Pr4_S-0.65um_50_18]|nr:hypothetical protein [Oscillatoriophycideae cyanobacterium NC_groundwater_1537_Pr4_S-0.65um_50_18]
MTAPRQFPQQWSRWLWIIPMLSFLGSASLLLSWVYTQNQHNERDWQTLTRAVARKEERQFADCMAELRQISHQSLVYETAQLVLHDCQTEQHKLWLDESNNLATRGQYQQAIQGTDRISQDSVYYDEAQGLAKASAERILDIARGYYLDPSGRLNDAIAALKEIPATSSMSALALQRSQAWQQTWTSNQQHWQTAKLALDTDDFDAVQRELSMMIKHPYWDTRVQELLVEVDRKQKYYLDLLQQAQDYKRQGSFDQALASAEQLPALGQWGQQKETVLNEIKMAREVQPQFQTPWTQLTIGALLVLFERIVHGSRYSRR